MPGPETTADNYEVYCLQHNFYIENVEPKPAFFRRHVKQLKFWNNVRS